MHIISYGLPPTFPAFMVPPEAQQFAIDTENKPVSSALFLAELLGYDQLWEKLPHIGENIYGLGLTVHGLCVLFMVKVDVDG